MVVSGDTVLRVVKRGAPPPNVDERLRVVGIDHWAWQKGQQHFGTILVDLERRRVVNVLAVRTADAVADWLAVHPGIRIISRDRHGHRGQRADRRCAESRVSGLRGDAVADDGLSRGAQTVSARPGHYHAAVASTGQRLTPVHGPRAGDRDRPHPAF
jgi:hypothetical protein